MHILRAKSSGSWNKLRFRKRRWGRLEPICDANRSHPRSIVGYQCSDSSETYPFGVNCNGISMLYDEERRRSPAMSAKRAKSVSRSWSAKRGERRDSVRRTSSNFLTSSNGACELRREIISEKAWEISFYGFVSCYTLLNCLNHPQFHLWTASDPIEETVTKVCSTLKPARALIKPSAKSKFSATFFFGRVRFEWCWCPFHTQ